MTKILEESVCPPCFSSDDEYENMYLARRWLDCVELIRSLEWAKSKDNKLAFLYALANEVANQIEVAQPPVQVCPVCGSNPCVCKVDNTLPPSNDCQPSGQNQVTIDFAAEGKNNIKVGDEITIQNKKSSLFGKKCKVSKISACGKKLSVSCDSKDSEISFDDLQPSIMESFDLKRLKYIAGIR